MDPFHFQDKYLYCEDICINQLLDNLPIETIRVLVDSNNLISVEVPSTPAYVYSAKALQGNVTSYLNAIKKFSILGKLGYAAKANGNLHILKLLRSYGVEVLVTVSGNEILAGLRSGFAANDIIFNGNGKQSWEIKLAIEQGVILNVDSIFDANRIARTASINFPTRNVKVLLRLRPSNSGCQVGVHPYVDTSTNSKFGFDLAELDEVIEILNKCKGIQIYGIHCHLGSCITNPNVYSYVGSFIASASKILKEKGIEIELCDIGGGISIDYKKVPLGFYEDTYYKSGPDGKDKTEIDAFPQIEEYMKIIGNALPKDTQIVIEPGRSLVGNAGVIVTKVLGSKSLVEKNFMVVDAAMTEIIRPPLYGSFHQIYPTKLAKADEWKKYDVVGPVCESADFLGHDRYLPAESEYLAIMDTGAYAASMASNYNMRPKPVEILVTGGDWKCIRQRETFNDLTKTSLEKNCN